MFDEVSGGFIMEETTFPVKLLLWLGEYSPIWLGELFSGLDNKTCCFEADRNFGFSDKIPHPLADRPQTNPDFTGNTVCLSAHVTLTAR